MKKTLALLVACALLTIAVGWCEEAPLSEGIRRMSFTSYDDEGRQDTNLTLYCGKDGLPLSGLLSYSYDSPLPIYVYYAPDARGNPERVRLSTDAERIDLTFTNTYDGDTLVKAVVADVTLDGESRMEDLLGMIGPDMSPFACRVVSAACSALKNFPGYRNAELTITGCDMFCLRFEDGQLASSLLPSSRGLLRTEYTWEPDGSYAVFEVSKPWPGEEESDDGWHDSYAYDARHCLLWDSFSVNGWPVTIRYRYQESIDPTTGQRLLLGFADSVEGEADADDAMEYMWSRPYDPLEPFMRYELNAAGEIDSVTVGLRTDVYDSRHRLVRQEYYDIGDYGLVRSGAEFEYYD